jgi:hypothetical protein
MASDVDYFSRRAQEERKAALRTSDAHVRDVHLQLADAYEQRLRELAADARRSGMHLVSAA